MLTRLSNSLRIAYICFTHPEIMFEKNLDILVGLLTLIFKVAAENKPYMSRIGVLLLGEEKPLVTVWACPDIEGTPEKRIEELLRENDYLRSEIQKIKEK